ncbi:capsule assembly Wzi family protein [Marinobacter sp. AL4B]|uniref:capsule assembly Wzi family protein n=1 Tax=Marinobacter sp. AL4B TaxID=2871173 RepID=UPI001CAA78CC|nr:capsule assembly Wzi family protein [Marinobacter sp. AL4B]MBZ0333198.1 capsule assembly Wzi family protein [Marinobacter sp. AL4B]
MPLTHWTRVGGAVACLVGIVTSTATYASPWIEPGDARARFALQKLADRGHFDRTVSTWPVMWSSVAKGINSSVTSDATATAGAMAYLNAEQQAQFSGGTRAEITLAGSSGQSLVQGFGDSRQEEGQATLDVEWQGEYWALGLSPSVVANPADDEEHRYDGSYLAAAFGNWVFGAGAIDRWWGPGWQSSLILSNNARPMPGVWLNRKRDLAPTTSWLSWVGPWNVTVFAGEFQDDRTIDSAKLIGMRFTFRPVQGFDIGLSRAIMFGGEGRPQNSSTLWNALIGKDNGQLGPDKEPGNQLGSIDVRYGLPVGEQALGVYAQLMGEDEAGAFPARKSWLVGSDWTTGFFQADQQWFLEYSNTTADDLFGSAMPSVSYEHSIYTTGYRQFGRNLASSFDSDAESVTFGLHQFFSTGTNLTVSLSYAKLNGDGVARAALKENKTHYFVPATNQEVGIVNVGYGVGLLGGTLQLGAKGTTEKIELLSGEQDQWSASASWKYRF